MKTYIAQISALLSALNSEAKNRQTTLANATAELASAAKAIFTEIDSKLITPENKPQLVELRKMMDSAINLALPHLKRGQQQDVGQRIGGAFRGLKLTGGTVNHVFSRKD